MYRLDLTFLIDGDTEPAERAIQRPGPLRFRSSGRP